VRRALLAAMLVAGCASRAAYTRGGGQLGVMVVRSESPAALEGEPVLAVADDGTRRLLLGAQTAWILRAGAAPERTPGTRRWTRAALLPAADGRGTWAVGLDDGGRLWRVRPGVGLEEVADRYALGGVPIRDVAAAGRRVAFLLEDALAVADGHHVFRYATPGARGFAAGGAHVALRFDDHVELLSFESADGAELARDQTAPVPHPAPRGADARTRVQLREPSSPGTGEVAARSAPVGDAPHLITPNLDPPPARAPHRLRYDVAARAIAIDGAGTLFVATRRAVYRADGPLLHLLYLADHDLRWLCAAGPRVWFADGDTLLSADETLAVAQGAPARPAPLAPAGDGSLWLLDQRRPTRLVAARASAAEERWLADVRPVFTRACAACHRPEGKSGVDLSTAAAWMDTREELRQRVLLRRTMPPAGRPISEDDRATIAAWLRALR
jgi:mono/diheme cytochrome c family protein